MTRKVSDEMLMAFVDGETDKATAAMIANRLAQDAGLAARAEDFRASRTLLREAFGDVRREAVPDILVETVMNAGQKDRKDHQDHKHNDNVVAFPLWRRLRQALPPAASLPLAASLVIGLVFGGYLLGLAGAGLPGQGATDLLGRSAIAAALATTRSGTSSAVAIADEQAMLRTLSTYRIENGLCRSFDLSGPDIALAGVGCDRGAGWTLDLTVAQAGAGDTTYAPASAAALSSIDAYLDTLEASAPLSPAEEDALLE